MPDSFRTKLVFNYATTLTPAAGAAAQLTFYHNSAWDCSIALGAGNAVGFSEWTAMYERFRVYGSQARVEATSRNAYASMVALTPVTDLTIVGTVNEALGNSRTVSAMLTPNTSMSKVSLIRSATTSELYGVTHNGVRNGVEFAGTEAYFPSNLAYWIVTL